MIIKRLIGIILSFIILGLFTISCTNKGSQEIGQFVYCDPFNKIHIDRQCASTPLDNLKTKEERILAMEGISYIDTCIFTQQSEGFCPKCINDATYDHLRAISMRNKDIDRPKKWLYDKLNRAGYDMEDYDVYIYNMANEQKRKWLFLTAQKEGWNIGESFEEFSNILGF